MESRFAKMMLYEERDMGGGIHPVEISVHVPPDATVALTDAALASRSRLEEITGQKVLGIVEIGKEIDIDLDCDEVPPAINLEEFRLTAERSVLFSLVAQSLSLGHNIVLGRDSDPDVYYADQIRILITTGYYPPADDSQIMYTRIVRGSQAKDLIVGSYPPKLDQNGIDERDELRKTLISGLAKGQRILLNPARKLN